MKNTGHEVKGTQKVPSTRVMPALQDLMVHLADGATRSDLPSALGIKGGGVQQYLHRLYRHFDIHSFHELRRIAIEDGWSNMALRDELQDA